MSIHTEEQAEIQGFAKEIDAGAIGLILDNLQQYQYQHPQKSAIRELVSNGLDAIREKSIALSILGGHTKVEDHFITRDDITNKDSNFNWKYYDPKWLWTPEATWYNTLPATTLVNADYANTVLVTYEEGGDIQKDKIVIEDFGVGMGGARLEGYFKIGYSTKRNTKEALGKFGIGAKAGLSTAPFYTMVSHYNGREYIFNVHPHTVVSIVPKINMATGKENKVHMFSNGAVIYYRETKMPNGVRVELESKKHHKDLYIQAVKSQLLYFDNVEFRIKNAQGGLDVVPIKAKIIYEDENILLSDNDQYSRPHVLISRVNYGAIDWRELELEDVRGNIAFKIPAEEVVVNPSRENLIWNDITRKTVVGYFEKIRTVAEKMISDQLKVDDFIEWMEACSQIQTRYGSDTVIGRLSQMVDMSSAKVPYINDPSIVYGASMFNGLQIRVNELQVIREGSTVKYKINRADYGIIQAIADGVPIYVQTAGASFKTDKYLLMGEHKNQGFITIKDPFAAVSDGGEWIGRVMDECPTTPLIESAAKDLLKLWFKQDWTEAQQATGIKHVKHRMWVVMEWLMKSKHLLKYDEVVVPEGFDSKEEVEDEKTIEEVKAKEERQKMVREKGIIPIFTPRNVGSSYITPSGKSNLPEHKLYEWQKIELPVSDIDKWDEDEVYFSNDRDSDLLHLAAMVTRPKNNLAWTVESEYANFGLLKDQPQSYQNVMNMYFTGSFRQHGGAYITLPKTEEVYNLDIAEIAKCHNFFQTTGEKPKVKLIKVAQDRVKYFLDFKPIQKFFMDIKNKTLTMSNALVRWNTARMIHEELSELRFLQNFERFHNKYCYWYRDLLKYTKENYRELKDHAKDSKYYALKNDSYDNLISHMQKVTRFQLFVRNNPTEGDKIAELAREMFNPKTEINDGLAIDLVMYDRLKELLDFAQPISILLNEVTLLTDMNSRFITAEVEQEVRGYCTSKGVTL